MRSPRVAHDQHVVKSHLEDDGATRTLSHKLVHSDVVERGVLSVSCKRDTCTEHIVFTPHVYMCV